MAKKTTMLIESEELHRLWGWSNRNGGKGSILDHPEYEVAHGEASIMQMHQLRVPNPEHDMFNKAYDQNAAEADAIVTAYNSALTLLQTSRQIQTSEIYESEDQGEARAIHRGNNIWRDLKRIVGKQFDLDDVFYDTRTGEGVLVLLGNTRGEYSFDNQTELDRYTSKNGLDIIKVKPRGGHPVYEIRF